MAKKKLNKKEPDPFSIFYGTQGRTKLWNYVQEMILRDDFRKEIEQLREVLDVPVGGFDEKDITLPPEQ